MPVPFGSQAEKSYVEQRVALLQVSRARPKNGRARESDVGPTNELL